MVITTKMWIWGFVVGVFMMAAINALASVLDGGGVTAWVQMIGSAVVVFAAITVSLRLRKAEDNSTSGT